MGVFGVVKASYLSLLLRSRVCSERELTRKLMRRQRISGHRGTADPFGTLGGSPP
jgi:hypothetical protein